MSPTVLYLSLISEYKKVFLKCYVISVRLETSTAADLLQTLQCYNLGKELSDGPCKSAPYVQKFYGKSGLQTFTANFDFWKMRLLFRSSKIFVQTCL